LPAGQCTVPVKRTAPCRSTQYESSLIVDDGVSVSDDYDVFQPSRAYSRRTKTKTKRWWSTVRHWWRSTREPTPCTSSYACWCTSPTTRRRGSRSPTFFAVREASRWFVVLELLNGWWSSVLMHHCCGGDGYLVGSRAGRRACVCGSCIRFPGDSHQRLWRYCLFLDSAQLLLIAYLPLHHATTHTHTRRTHDAHTTHTRPHTAVEESTQLYLKALALKPQSSSYVLNLIHGLEVLHATQRNATQRNATQRNATQRNATQRNATQRNATQRNATQRNALLKCLHVD
jgi:hypothetical protein